ncbi:MAG: copper resistance protein NlpE N-terminal domain-containing protein [Alistipes sp.]|nr:copper resistance protein NlpE N-terminal domain-containing protein [Alistipes sp.]
MRKTTLCTLFALSATACVTHRSAVEYEGVLPAADCPGVIYSLTLNADIEGSDTLFMLKQTYLEAGENGENISFELQGVQRMREGKYIQLQPDNGEQQMNFYLVDDNTIRYVNADFQSIANGLNYDLKRK